MKRYLMVITTIIVITVSLLSSCKKNDFSAFNRPPVANAGTDQIVILPKDSVSLTGMNSSDPDGKINSYQWTWISGPASYFIVSPGSVNTVVRSLVLGVYKFELSIKDDRGAIDRDTVQISVIAGNGSNQKPVARAGIDQNILLPLNSCVLYGLDSYDPDGLIVNFQWAKIQGPATFLLIDDDNPVAQVKNMVEGYYRFELTVTDNGGLVGKDTVQVAVYSSATGICDVSNRNVNNYNLTEVGTLSVARTPAIAAAGDKIVFAGGRGVGNSVFSVVDIYNTSTQSWSTAQLSQPRGSISAFSYGNKIYFAGGSILGTVDLAYDNVDVYDVVTNTWTLAHLSTPRAEVATAAVGSKIFFAGGTPDWWRGSTRIDIYDTATKLWSTAELSERKMNVSAITVGSKVYFAGGEELAQGYQGIDIYDDVTKSWSTTSLQGLIGIVSGTAIGNTIYWAGTVWTGNNSWISKVEIWNTGNSTITSNCLCFIRSYPKAIAKNNQVAFFGWDSNYPVTNRFDIFNAQTNTWSIGLIGVQLGSPEIIMVNNTVYMAGGVINGSVSDKVYTLNW